METIKAEVLDLAGLCAQEFFISVKALLASRTAADSGTLAVPERNLSALYSAAFRELRFPPGQPPAGGSRASWSAALAQLLAGHFEFRLPRILKVIEEEGEFGTTSKALLHYPDGVEIECVKIPVPSRGRRIKDPLATLCISSQAGCRMGCAFCETGTHGFIRNLSAAEIVSQYLVTKSGLGWEVGNIVFMGMGEPLDNVDSVSLALKVLLDPAGPGFSQEAITVCTSGIPEGIAALRLLGLKRLNLSVSLNAPDDQTRTKLMPVTRLHSLDSVASALRTYPMRRNFILGVNYCLIPGMNDGPDAAAGVAAFVREASVENRAFINLIPYNPGSVPLGPAPSGDEIENFRTRLVALGLRVKVRTPRGRDLMAACGQLGSDHGE